MFFLRPNLVKKKNRNRHLLICFIFIPLRNDAAQSDDDDKSQPPLTDTDGGKLKQKT